MKSAREIACSSFDCNVSWGYPRHSGTCDDRTESIQQAREDGARWALDEAERTGFDDVKPADVRQEAP